MYSTQKRYLILIESRVDVSGQIGIVEFHIGRSSRESTPWRCTRTRVVLRSSELLLLLLWLIVLLLGLILLLELLKSGNNVKRRSN